MFTTATKAFLGAAAAALVGVLLFGIVNPDSYPAIASMSMVGLGLSLAGLGITTSYFRDSTVSAMDDAAVQTSAANTQPIGSSVWPLAAAGSLVLLTIGIVTDGRFFIAGLVVLLAAIVQWMLTAWSERATGDTSANADVRSRIAGSWEVPLGGGIVAAGIIWAMSRIFLANSAVFSLGLLSVLALVVVLIGALYSANKLSRAALIGFSAIAAMGLVGGGIASAFIGESHHLEEEAELADELARIRTDNSPAELEILCGEEGDEHFDEKSSGGVSATAGTYATFTLTDGGLELDQYLGVTPGGVQELLLVKGNNYSILFRNETAAERRLTITGGEFTVKVGTLDENKATVFCTQLIEEGEEQLLTVKLPRSSAPDDPFKAFVPGTDETIDVVVP